MTEPVCDASCKPVRRWYHGPGQVPNVAQERIWGLYIDTSDDRGSLSGMNDQTIIRKLVESVGGQAKAAELLGINQGQVSRILTGKRTASGPVARLARLLLQQSKQK